MRALEAEGLDGVLVTSRANIRYLTGFSGSAALVAATRADLLLVTDFRYDEQARAEAAAVARVEVESTSVWERLFKELATLGSLVAVGYEAHALTVKDAERLAEGGKAWRWKPTTELVERLRVRKDAGEVAAIRSAAALAGEALARTLREVRPGLSELEIAGVLEGALRRLGSEGHPFPTIVASGPRTRPAPSFDAWRCGEPIPIPPAWSLPRRRHDAERGPQFGEGLTCKSRTDPSPP